MQSPSRGGEEEDEEAEMGRGGGPLALGSRSGAGWREFALF